MVNVYSLSKLFKYMSLNVFFIVVVYIDEFFDNL